MKIRRVQIEIEVPWFVSAGNLLELLRDAVDEAGGSMQHQAQIIGEAVSPNTQIGRCAGANTRKT